MRHISIAHILFAIKKSLYLQKGHLSIMAMTSFSVDIEKVTPEIHRILEQLQAHAGVKITPKSEPSAWDRALAEGAVSVDEFFHELDSRIDKWSESRA